MKKWLFAFTLTILLIPVISLCFKKSTPQAPSPNKVLSAIEEPTTPPSDLKQSAVVNIDSAAIRISWTIVSPEQVELYSNLKTQQLSEQIKVDKSCQILVNGGFYSKENTHLGLFITDFEIISKAMQSATYNGFLWITNNNNISIGDNPPDINSRIVIQSGPLLIKDGEPLALDINNDEPNRRIVAAATDNNRLLFLVFYRDLNEYEGPLLAQLPEIIKLFQKQTSIDIIDAINLDGGKHSVFITNYVRLNELEHIGSYFCIE